MMSQTVAQIVPQVVTQTVAQAVPHALALAIPLLQQHSAYTAPFGVHSRTPCRSRSRDTSRHKSRAQSRALSRPVSRAQSRNPPVLPRWPRATSPPIGAHSETSPSVLTKPQSTACFATFKRYVPPTYAGAMDGVTVEEWIHQIDKLLRSLDVPDDGERVHLASHAVTDLANS